MKVLVACECSGTVRDAFRSLGHDAWSCDLKPDVANSPFHLQGDALQVLTEGWDMMIAHPPCTYLSTCAAWAFKDGPYHQQVKPGTLVGKARREAQEQAVTFFLQFWNAPIERIAIENPIGAMSSRLFKPQTIQPYNFGDDASKGTCLWLKNLPELKPTLRVPGRIVTHKGKQVERWANQTDSGQNRLGPSEERAAIRAVTYPGIAKAMAQQWGGFE